MQIPKKYHFTWWILPDEKFQWSKLLWDFLFPNASHNNYSVAESQMNLIWFLTSQFCTHKSHSSSAHQSKPKNQKLTTKIVFWSFLSFTVISQLTKSSINFLLTSTGWLWLSRWLFFLILLLKWVKNDPDPNWVRSANWFKLIINCTVISNFTVSVSNE